MQVGLRTNDGLNIYIADDGSYHFAFYERGKLGFDRSGSLDDLLYWYCESVITRQAAKRVGDRAERFKYEYQVLSHLNTDWAKRKVRETAAMFPQIRTARGHFLTSRHRRSALTLAHAAPSITQATQPTACEQLLKSAVSMHSA